MRRPDLEELRRRPWVATRARSGADRSASRSLALCALWLVLLSAPPSWSQARPAPTLPGLDLRGFRAEMARLRRLSAANVPKYRSLVSAKHGARATEATTERGRVMRVQIRRGLQGLEGLLLDGYLKTASEVGDKHWSNAGGEGQDYLPARERFEQQVGFDGLRVAYGTLVTDEAESKLSGRYGPVVIVLRDEKIRHRTTFTPYDSLDFLRRKARADFERDLVTWEGAATLSATGKYVEYFEAQIRGGVRLKDIAAIELPAGSSFDRYEAAIRAKAPHIKVVRTGEWVTGAGPRTRPRTPTQAAPSALRQRAVVRKAEGRTYLYAVVRRANGAWDLADARSAEGLRSLGTFEALEGKVLFRLGTGLGVDLAPLSEGDRLTWMTGYSALRFIKARDQVQAIEAAERALEPGMSASF